MPLCFSCFLPIYLFFFSGSVLAPSRCGDSFTAAPPALTSAQSSALMPGSSSSFCEVSPAAAACSTCSASTALRSLLRTIRAPSPSRCSLRPLAPVSLLVHSRAFPRAHNRCCLTDSSAASHTKRKINHESRIYQQSLEWKKIKEKSRGHKLARPN